MSEEVPHWTELLLCCCMVTCPDDMCWWLQEYIRYFTGLDNVLLLPNICGYVTERYAPTRPEVLLAPARGIDVSIHECLLAWR